jgi:hypothetical protein
MLQSLVRVEGLPKTRGVCFLQRRFASQILLAPVLPSSCLRIGFDGVDPCKDDATEAVLSSVTSQNRVLDCSYVSIVKTWRDWDGNVYINEELQ